MIAIVSMTIDHIGSHLIRNTHLANLEIISLGSHTMTLYELLRYTGRLAFPIFAFLLVEGVVHTKSRKKYGMSLALFALISEIPWNLVHGGSLLYKGQNVFFTLFLGFVGIQVIDKFKEFPSKQIKWLLVLLLVSIFLRADYGSSGFGFILLLYVLRRQVLLKSIIGSCFLPSRWIAGLAFIPISMYNGERGFIKGRFLKFAFYFFYPLHLFVFYIIKYNIL